MASAANSIKGDAIKAMNVDIDKLSLSELCANIKTLLLDLKANWIKREEKKKVQHVVAISVSPPLVKLPPLPLRHCPKWRSSKKHLLSPLWPRHYHLP